MTKHALVIAAFLLLCGCSIGEPIQLSSCETSIPGPNCPPKETCTGQCVVVPPLGVWDRPALLWFGPVLDAPACPADRAPLVGYEGYADPIDPPACSPSACTCEPPIGVCGLPSVLAASTDTMCPDDALAMHADFSGLDRPGICKSENPVLVGYGLVTVEPLTLTETGCKPSGPPPPTEGSPAAKTFARACKGSASACLNPSMSCVPAIPLSPPGFLQCIFQSGEHACPDEYPNQHVFYDEITGFRGCSACSCAAPKGGECSATVTIFQDGSCSGVPNGGSITSSEPACINVNQGNSLGGKKVTAPSYQPGTCEPIGGEPIDSVELKGPSTFCCQK